MDDWTLLTADRPRLVGPDRTGEITGPARPWDRPVPAWAEDLDRLLRAGTITPVILSGEALEVIGWPTGDGRTGWLAPEPHSGPLPTHLHPDHAALLATFGGVTERFQEPATWLRNTNRSLTIGTAGSDAHVLDDYEWLWEDDGLVCPIAPADRASWYVVSEEANGNGTLVHRESGQIAMFAPDHAFDHITPWPECPEYSLYSIDGAPDLRSWVNAVARQWLAVIAA